MHILRKIAIKVRPPASHWQRRDWEEEAVVRVGDAACVGLAMIMMDRLTRSSLPGKWLPVRSREASRASPPRCILHILEITKDSFSISDPLFPKIAKSKQI